MNNRPREFATAIQLALIACALAWIFSFPSYAAELADDQAIEKKIVDQQTKLGERFDRLEILAGRLAELTRSTQPSRAKLLRQFVAQSRTNDVPGRFEEIVKLLEHKQFSNALGDQKELQGDLQQLLELLLTEDRDRQIESERKRVSQYLQDLKKLLRRQRGIAARTEGGDEQEPLARDQERVKDQTDELRNTIEKAEGSGKLQAGDKSSETPSQGKPSEGQPSEGSSGENKPQEGQPGEPGERSSGSESAEESSDSDSQQPESQSVDPKQRAMDRLKRAQQKMRQAQKQLEESQREGAREAQEQAIRDLEAAKAELERILRQLREEELERMLVLLEARFRKMLEAQVTIYDETKRLEKGLDSTPRHELEIAAGRLSRQERQIVQQADRALVLLREDGTSVAFPEAIEQAREDMQAVAVRLVDVKVGLITQGLEEDVISALEETLAALQEALEQVREQQNQQQQQQQGGQPGEQPLVKRLAELRMIKALQQRVNKRTTRYGSLIEGEQALEAELLDALQQLAERQERIFEATQDLHTGRNK